MVAVPNPETMDLPPLAVKVPKEADAQKVQEIVQKGLLRSPQTHEDALLYIDQLIRLISTKDLLWDRHNMKILTEHFYRRFQALGISTSRREVLKFLEDIREFYIDPRNSA